MKELSSSIGFNNINAYTVNVSKKYYIKEKYCQMPLFGKIYEKNIILLYKYLYLVLVRVPGTDIIYNNIMVTIKKGQTHQIKK